MPTVMMSPGFSERQVYVNTVDKSVSMAQCSIVGTNASMSVSTIPVRCGRSPRAGETWLVEKNQSGSWTFTAILATRDALAVPPVVFGADEPKLQSDYIGQRYISLSQPNGATMWESVASNSDHWTVVRGETEWVNAKASAGTGVKLDEAMCKRIDSRVVFTIAGSSSAASGTALLVLPKGCSPVATQRVSVATLLLSSSGDAMGVVTVSPGDSQAVVSITKAGSFAARDEWTTGEDWPSLS